MMARLWMLCGAFSAILSVSAAASPIYYDWKPDTGSSSGTLTFDPAPADPENFVGGLGSALTFSFSGGYTVTGADFLSFPPISPADGADAVAGVLTDFAQLSLVANGASAYVQLDDSVAVLCDDDFCNQAFTEFVFGTWELRPESSGTPVPAPGTALLVILGLFFARRR